MNKIQTFFRTFTKSLTSPSYYADIIKAPFSFSFKYFFVFFFLYAIIGSVVIGVKFISPLPKILSVLPEKIEQIYPEELVVTVKNGSVSTNVKEPYYIPINKLYSLFSYEDMTDTESPEIQYLVVIDTKGDVENFASYHTLALVTEKSIMFADNNRGNRLISINPNMSGVLDRSIVNKFIVQFTPLLSYVVPLIMVLVFLGIFILNPTNYLMYILFLASCLWLLAKVMKVVLSYGKSYQLGLHMVTISASIFGVLSIINVHIRFPFFQTILLLIWGAAVFSAIKEPHKKMGDR